MENKTRFKEWMSTEGQLSDSTVTQMLSAVRSFCKNRGITEEQFYNIRNEQEVFELVKEYAITENHDTFGWSSSIYANVRMMLKQYREYLWHESHVN